MQILDPFAGTGRIHDLADPHAGVETFGVELEPEWGLMRDGTVIGNALDVVEMFGVASFDMVMTSPCYGNRMADHHEAKDACKRCKGAGVVPDPLDASGEGVCPDCRGSRLSKRNTYKAALGRTPTRGSAAVMQWGPEYRRFHRDCVVEFPKLLRPHGRLVVNVKNHYRRKEEQLVSEWWLATMLAQGLRFVRGYPVEARGNRQGENGHVHRDPDRDAAVRTEVEFVFVCEKP